MLRLRFAYGGTFRQERILYFVMSKAYHGTLVYYEPVAVSFWQSVCSFPSQVIQTFRLKYCSTCINSLNLDTTCPVWPKFQKLIQLTTILTRSLTSFTDLAQDTNALEHFFADV